MFEGGLFEFGDWVVEKYVQLRSNWVNRITWLVVYSGLLLCAEPLWKPIFDEALQRYFGIDIVPAATPWIGLALVVIGLLFHYLKLKNNAGELTFEDRDRRKHDASIYLACQKKLEHQELRSILEWIETNDALFTNDRKKLADFARFLVAPENHFLDENLQAAAEDLASSISKLNSFIVHHFFVYPDVLDEHDGYQVCLYPDHNMDRRGDGSSEQIDFYEAKVEEMLLLVSGVKESHVNFISVCKAALGEASVASKP